MSTKTAKQPRIKLFSSGAHFIHGCRCSVSQSLFDPLGEGSCRWSHQNRSTYAPRCRRSLWNSRVNTCIIDLINTTSFRLRSSGEETTWWFGFDWLILFLPRAIEGHAAAYIGTLSGFTAGVWHLLQTWGRRMLSLSNDGTRLSAGTRSISLFSPLYWEATISF